MKKFVQIISLVVVVVVFTGCAGTQKSTRNAAIGAGTGGVIGGVAGNNIDGLNTVEGAAAGALIGGVVGWLDGNNRDRNDALYYQQQQQQQKLWELEQRQQQSHQHSVNSGGRPSHEEAHRLGIPHKCPDGTQWNKNQSSSGSGQPASTYSNRASTWEQSSNGYDLQPVVNVTNIYGNVYTGRDGYRYYDNCGRCHKSHRVNSRCF